MNEHPCKRDPDPDSDAVALARCRDYSPAELVPALEQVLTTVPPPDTLVGKQVFLKPNLISSRHGTLPCTEAAMILATARWFLDRGARVYIGDSPAFGTAHGVLNRLGILDELESFGVTLSDFSETRRVQLASGISVRMPLAVLECDLLVNLPRVKAHAQTRVTLAVKNCFGCLTGLQKPLWHMKYGGKGGSFAGLLLEILDLLPRSLTVVDGVRAMHVSGPIHGKPYRLGLIAAGRDPVAVDTALLRMLGLDPDHSPLHREARLRRLVHSRLEELSFPLLAPGELAVDDFLVPEELNPIRFNPLSFVLGLPRRLVTRYLRREGGKEGC